MSEKIPHIPGAVPGDPYQGLIRQFLLMMYQEGKSLYTIKTYGWYLNRFGIWMLEKGIFHPNQVSPPDLLEWGGHIRSKYSPQSQKVCSVATKSFYRFLLKLRACSEFTLNDVTNFLASPRIRMSPQRTLNGSEVANLILMCGGDEEKDIRDRTLIALLLDSGLRAAELCGIKQKDVDIDQRRILILGKGGEKELVYFGFECQKILQEWIDIRKALSSKTDYLFVSLGGNTPQRRITTRGLRAILKQLGEKANVLNVHPHAFRRSFATMRIKDGQSTRAVQQLGRWKNLAMFERYTQALLMDDDFARNEAANFSPLKHVAPK